MKTIARCLGSVGCVAWLTLPVAADAPARHTEGITCLAYAVDGTLVSGGADGSVVLWDVAARREKAVLRIDDRPVAGLSLSADGRTLAAVAHDRAFVWELPLGRRIGEVQSPSSRLTVVAVSPDGKTIALGDERGTVTLRSRGLNDRPARITQFRAAVTALAFHRGGDCLAAASAGGHLALGNTKERKESIPTNYSGAGIVFLGFAADERRPFLAGPSWVESYDQRSDSFKEYWWQNDIGTVTTAALGPVDRPIVWGSSKGAIRYLDSLAEAEKVESLFWPVFEEIRAVAVSPDGNTLVVAGRRREGKGLMVIERWKKFRGPTVAELKSSDVERRYPGSQLSIAFAAGGGAVVTAGEDGIVRSWPADAVEPGPLQRHLGAAHAVAVSPDGRLIASGGRDRLIRVWDTAKKREAAVLEGHTGPVLAVAFSPDGRTLVSSSPDRTVRLWDIASAKETLKLTQAATGLTAAAFSPDGKTLATAGGDGVLRFRDAATGELIATVAAHKGAACAIAFAPDGESVMTASVAGAVKLWDAAERRERRSFADGPEVVTAVTFSPDGKRIAVAGLDGETILWDAATGDQLERFEGHRGTVTGLAFAPDGRTLATSGRDGTVRLRRTVAQAK